MQFLQQWKFSVFLKRDEFKRSRCFIFTMFIHKLKQSNWMKLSRGICTRSSLHILRAREHASIIHNAIMYIRAFVDAVRVFCKRAERKSSYTRGLHACIHPLPSPYTRKHFAVRTADAYIAGVFRNSRISSRGWRKISLVGNWGATGISPCHVRQSRPQWSWNYSTVVKWREFFAPANRVRDTHRSCQCMQADNANRRSPQRKSNLQFN